MKKSEKEFAILGLGRMSLSLLETLAMEDANVLVIDENKEKIESIANKATRAVVGDVTDINVLKSMDVASCDVVIVGMGTALENNIMACVLLKELGAPYIIAKAKNKQHKLVLEKIGVDKVVLPEAEIGARIALNILNASKLNYVEYNSGYTIIEFETRPEWIGKNLINLNLRRKEGMNIIAIRKKNEYGHIEIAPSAEYIIKKDDLLIAIVPAENINEK